MRFEKLICPRKDETRIKTWFAVWPFSLYLEYSDGRIIKETRWLEKVSVQQKYDDDFGWIETGFVDSK